MKKKKISKTVTKKLLARATAVLLARRSGNIKREQAAWERLHTLCAPLGLDTGDVVEQAREHLRKTSIAANMNGIV